MRRRELIALLGGAAVFCPLAARAQQSAPIRPLIGLLSPLSAKAATRNIAAFRSALRDFGYLEGRDLTLALRYGDGAAERMPSLARELVGLKPDVLFGGSFSGALAAHAATSTIPIVTITAEDPVKAGLADSIARPGKNITGTWLLGADALVGKRLEFLKLAVPGIARVGTVLNPDDPTDAVTALRLPAAANALGITLSVFEVRDASRLKELPAEIARTGVQGLFVGQGPTINTARAEIAALAARLRLPAVFGFREFADAGGLMSYGPNLPDTYRQSARLVHRILKGANPADLPFELPTRYELIVNLRTAKAIGLNIPEAFLLLVDEVIE
ncbi:MAG TPA: ABC transporter substrate-binding protein [Xanthobacteraceae bacterium]|jgi:putative ABC transport system substrate-binding protein